MSSHGKEPIVRPDGTADWDRIEVTAADIAQFALGGEVVEQSRPTPAPAKAEIVGDEDDALVLTLRSLKTDLGIADDARIVSPGSSSNVAIARAFGKGATIHVDPDKAAIEALTEHGYLATESRIEDFVPDAPYDVLVATNSYGSPTQSVLDRLVRPGGLIITNNYTEWAHEIDEATSADLVGAVVPNYSSKDATHKPADQLPSNVTGMGVVYFGMRDGKFGVVDGPGQGVFADEAARYPDALFVFRMPETPAQPAPPA